MLTVVGDTFSEAFTWLKSHEKVSLRIGHLNQYKEIAESFSNL